MQRWRKYPLCDLGAAHYRREPRDPAACDSPGALLSQVVHRPDHDGVHHTGGPWRATPCARVSDPRHLQKTPQLVLALACPHKTHRKPHDELRPPASLAYEPRRLDNGSRSVSDRQDDVVTPLLPGATYTRGRPRNTRARRQHVCFSVMYTAPHIDAELFQKAALQSACHH